MSGALRGIERTMRAATQLTLPAVIAIPIAGPASAAENKPNIVVIFGDDIGWMNVSAYGGTIMGVKTPNIDRLAKEGLRLTSFYAQPSRAAGRAAFVRGQLPAWARPSRTCKRRS
jgi:arylsulfatase